VLEYDPANATAKSAGSAYPMTMPVYAALNPLQTDAAQRAIYANLIRYAVGSGQIPGTEIGQLPNGYTPLPQSWVAQALAAASAIERGGSPASTVPETAQAAGSAAYLPASTTGGAAAAQSASAPVADAAVDPAATGTAAGPLVGKPTPADPVVGPIRAAVPAGLLSGLLAAGGVPLISRIRRRS